MSLQVRLWLAAIAVCTTGGAAVSAGPALTPNEGAGPGAVPSIGGSWLNSCTMSGLQSLQLTATCKRIDGSSRVSAIRLTDCGQPTRLGNSDGQVVCESGSRQVPAGGSWARSCLNETLSGTVLTAACMNKRQLMTVSSLDLALCNAPTAVGNQDGQLVCESGARQRQTLQEHQVQGTTRPIVVAPENQTVVPLLEGLGIIFGVQP